MESLTENNTGHNVEMSRSDSVEPNSNRCIYTTAPASKALGTQQKKKGVDFKGQEVCFEKMKR